MTDLPPTSLHIPDKPGHIPGPTEGLDALANRCLALLRQVDLGVACAESFTGGRLATAFTAVPGASKHFCGGWVAYTPEAKARMLGLPESMLNAGLVTEEVALAMATAAAELGDIGIGTTGEAGPKPVDPVPVGTCFIAVVMPDRGVRLVREFSFEGDRLEIRDAGVRAALRMAIEMILATRAQG